jgi:hypothetical protein
MITRQSIAEHLLTYFNQAITLVDWAENCFAVGEFGPEQDVRLLREVVMYLAAADTAAFPLTWEVHEAVGNTRQGCTRRFLDSTVLGAKTCANRLFWHC